jgi:AcrR family transcriptional regulator
MSEAVSKPGSYLAFLKERLVRNEHAPKRERTRERLRIAALQVLEDRGFEAMTALLVTERAALSEGLFYSYFKSKVDITLDLIREFHLEFLLRHPLAVERRTPDGLLAGIRRANRIWLEAAVANPGMMRCVFQAGNEIPEISTWLGGFASDWRRRISRALDRAGVETGPVTTLRLYMLAGMMDELVRKLVVYPDPSLLGMLDTTDLEALADEASMIWLRVLRDGDHRGAMVAAAALDRPPG